MNSVKPENFGFSIRKLREEKELPLRKVAAYLDIDMAILSKIERGKRDATRMQVIKLASFYEVDEDDLLVAWLSDRLVYDLKGEKNAVKALHLAEEKVAYRMVRSGSSLMVEKLGSIMQQFPAIRKAWLFGSFARQEGTDESDIDVLIDVPKEEIFTLFDIAEVKQRLKQIANRKVDVVMLRALRPSVKERIQPDLKLIYEA